MGFFENAFNEIKKVSKKASDKANEVYAVTKKKNELADVKKKITKTYEEIGKIIYEAKKDILDSTSEIDAMVATIDELLVKEKQINEEIKILKSIIVCQSCQTENAFEAVYCVKCGAMLVKPVKEDEVEETQEEKDAVSERITCIENKAEVVTEEKVEVVAEEKAQEVLEAKEEAEQEVKSEIKE